MLCFRQMPLGAQVCQSLQAVGNAHWQVNLRYGLMLARLPGFDYAPTPLFWISDRGSGGPAMRVVHRTVYFDVPITKDAR